MSLDQYLGVLRRRWRWVTALACIGMAVAAFLSLTTAPTYQATSSLFFSLRFGDSANDLAQGSNFAQNQTRSYAVLASTPAVLSPVIERLELDTTVRQLASQVSTAVVPDTVVVEVSVTADTPETAARLANAVTEQLVETVEDLAPVNADGLTTVAATTVAPAAPPTAPIAPRTTLNTVVGLLAGLALGVLVAVGRELTDTRVRTRDDLALVTGLPVIGTLGQLSSGPERRVVVAADPHGTQAEAFRRLRTNLQFVRIGEAASGEGGQVISVTSALATEGKSTVAVNLAVALAETGAKVLLVDADLRRPAVADVLGLEGAAGLTTVLAGQATVNDVVQEWGPGGLRVLSAGHVPPNPAELLGSPVMHALLVDLRQLYDYVVLDTAPLLPVADAAILSRVVDGTVLVARAGTLRRAQLTEALTGLEQVEGRVLGIVLNRVRQDDEAAYGYEPRAQDVLTARLLAPRPTAKGAVKAGRAGRPGPSGATRSSLPGAPRTGRGRPVAGQRPAGPAPAPQEQPPARLYRSRPRS